MGYDNSDNSMFLRLMLLQDLALRVEGANIGSNDPSNPFTYLRFGASQYGAADIRPTNDGSHKVGLAFYTDGTQDTTINPTERVRISSAGDATFKYKVTIGDSYAGGEILSVGKRMRITSYMSFHNGGANMGFIGYADQLIAGGGSNDLGIRSQDEIRFATGGNTERMRLSAHR